MSVGLPDDATGFSIQLCSTYYGGLTPEIRTQMDKDKFRMPVISGGFTMKRKQLEALRKVTRTAASSAYKTVKEETNRIKKLMGQMYNGGRSGNSFYHSQNEHQYQAPYQEHEARGTSLFHSESQAEQTIMKYNEPAKTEDRRSRHFCTRSQQHQKDIVTRRNPETGKDHPYNPHLDYISKYPVGFRGSFRCGKDYHGEGKRCHLVDAESKKELWNEMWAHISQQVHMTPLVNPLKGRRNMQENP